MTDANAGVTAIADSVAALEERLTGIRSSAPGSIDELAVVVELATRLVRDPARRAEMAKVGLGLAEVHGDEVRAARCRAVTAEVKGRHGHAIDVLPEALAVVDVTESLGDEMARAQAHHAAAWIYCMVNCPTEALQHGSTALDRYRDVDDRFGEGRMLSLMAQIFEDLGDQTSADGFLEQAYGLFVDCDDPSGAAVTLADLAQSHRRAGHLTQAVKESEQALAMFDEIGKPLDTVQPMVAMAHALADLGDVEAATQWAERAVAHTAGADGVVASSMLRYDALLALARCACLEPADLDEAERILQEANAIAEVHNWRGRLAETERQLANVFEQRGDLRESYRHLLRHCDLARDVAQQTLDHRVQALEVGFRMEVARREAALFREQALRHEATIDELRATREELSLRMSELQSLHADAVELNRRDALTGLYSRRYTYELLQPLFATAAAGGAPLTVGALDIDDFKRINDRFGHEVGDTVLRAVAGHMEATLSAPRFGARIGGDELLVVFASTTSDDAVAACESLRSRIAGHPWDAIAAGLQVSVSIGVSGHVSAASVDDLLKAADVAMYRAKRDGKDRVSR